jgi:hypothetical protein
MTRCVCFCRWLWSCSCAMLMCIPYFCFRATKDTLRSLTLHPVLLPRACVYLSQPLESNLVDTRCANAYSRMLYWCFWRLPGMRRTLTIMSCCSSVCLSWPWPQSAPPGLIHTTNKINSEKPALSICCSACSSYRCLSLPALFSSTLLCSSGPHSKTPAVALNYLWDVMLVQSETKH